MSPAAQEVAGGAFRSGVGHADAAVVATSRGVTFRSGWTIAEEYRAAWHRGGSARELASVVEHQGRLAASWRTGALRGARHP